MFLLIAFIFMLNINYTQQYKLDIDCINGNNNGIHYKGTVNTTATGIPCIVWNNKHNNNVHYYADHNYCRNPDNSKVPWCYADTTGHPRQNCNIRYCGYMCPDLNPTPHLVQPTNLNKHKVSNTVIFRCAAGFILSGSKSATCKYVYPDNMGSWNAIPPNCIEDCRRSLTDLNYTGHINTTRQGYTCKYWNTTKYSKEEQNYCRTPPHDPDNGGGPWCYTFSGKRGWERCNIPVCRYCRNSTTDQHYKGYINTTRNGYACTYWKDAPKFNREEENYCRTPSGDADNTGSPWCYTSKGGDWDRCNVPVCGGKSCPNLINHLIPKDGKSKYHFGETVYLSCDTGYHMKGDMIISCDQSGQWNATIPTCQEITCTRMSLNLTEGMTVMKNTDSYNYGEMVAMSCKSGFIGTPVTSQCIDVNTWSHSPPICTEITCTRTSLHLTPLVNVQNDKETYSFQEDVTISCNTGYSGKPVISRCTNVNKWSENNPTCTEITCNQISLNLSQHVTSINKGKSSYDFLENVTVSCKPGFKGQSTTPKCTDIDKWSGTIPMCTKITCKQLSLNLTQYVVITKEQKQSYVFQENVELSCKPGFTGKSMTRQCTDVNVWSSNIPICTKEEADKLPLGGPIGGAVGGVVIILVVIAVVVFIARKRRHNGKPKQNIYQESENKNTGNKRSSKAATSSVYAEIIKEENTTGRPVTITDKGNVYYNEVGADNGGYYDFSTVLIPKTAIKMNEFYDYVEKGRGKDGKLEQEFMKLKSGLQKPTQAALKPGNKMKNKYRNIYAYDETRVVLDKNSESDYINASFIHGHAQARKYIASQGPLTNTVDEFWKMVWQYDCGKIVMLTNIFEDGKQKCIQYWPDSNKNKETFGPTDIILTKEDVCSDFTVRYLQLQQDKQCKNVIQFHFTAWPDKDVPKYASSLVHFRHKVNSTNMTRNGPMVVHCSAGIGRTGTFIALDLVVNQAQDQDYVDVFGCVEALRNQRVNMVQTQHQYAFLHEAILEALVCPNSGTPSTEFPDMYKNLMRFDIKQKKHKLYIEYETMNAVSPKHDGDVFDKGKSPENKGKNRYSNIIPVGSEMPMLSTSVDGHNEYINAVFLPGYRSTKTFIVTQMPLESTIIDLWRLVYDYDIPVVVMLNQDNPREVTDNSYWADTKSPVTFGPFSITQTSKDTTELYNCLSLTISYKNKEERTLKLFQSKFWNDDSVVPSSPNDILAFMMEVENGQAGRGSGPLLVHCLNGCDKSGLYCVLATVIERLRIEQDVDIQHIIKQMRNRRPQIIPNYEQFQFLYEAVIEYMKQFETYSNFQ